MKNFPEIVTFRVTSVCNNHCQYCYGPKNIPALPFREVIKIARLLSQKGTRAIVLTGGEPLLRPDIDQILGQFKKYRLKIFLDINGDFFLNHRKAINRYVDRLGLPLDAVLSKRSFRKPDNLGRVLGVLEYYKNWKKKRPKLRVGTVVTRRNINDLQKIARLLKRFPVGTWKIYQFIPIGKIASQNKRELLVGRERFFTEADRVYRQYSRYLKIVVSPRDQRASAYFLINPDGQVIMPVDDQKSCRETIVGDIFDGDIVEKWQRLILENNYLNNAETTFAHRWQNYPMDPIYNKIWQIAQYYCRQGQFYTEDHIQWHIKEALTIAKQERIDQSIFIPLIILHDIGYLKIPEENPFKKNTRKAHMKAGEKITRDILKEVNYPTKKTEEIACYVSIHDRWALGENRIYQKDKILNLFNDLDYISMYSPEGFPAMGKLLKKNPFELLNYLKNDEKLPKRPFCSQATKKLYKKYLTTARREVLA